MNLRLHSTLAILALLLGTSSHGLSAAGVTAFDLAKEGDKVIPAQARDKITQMRSEKSTSTLAPDVWYIDYFDPTAAFKTTEVQFVAGKVKRITRPKRLFDSFTGTRQLDWRKLKINSDRALAIALKEPLLKNLHLRASQFWLERTPMGAAWKIRFWASRQGKPDQTVEIGDLSLSAKTADIIKTDLHTRDAD
ncbi:MAG: hypothetical protein ABSA83_11485 [Verrucomicrobiota bacterium]|jgi:hypothetical protein